MHTAKGTHQFYVRVFLIPKFVSILHLVTKTNIHGFKDCVCVSLIYWDFRDKWKHNDAIASKQRRGFNVQLPLPLISIHNITMGLYKQWPWDMTDYGTVRDETVCWSTSVICRSAQCRKWRTRGWKTDDWKNWLNILVVSGSQRLQRLKHHTYFVMTLQY